MIATCLKVNRKVLTFFVIFGHFVAIFRDLKIIETYLDQAGTLVVALNGIKLLGCRNFCRQIFIFHADEKEVSKNKQNEMLREWADKKFRKEQKRPQKSMLRFAKPSFFTNGLVKLTNGGLKG